MNHSERGCDHKLRHQSKEAAEHAAWSVEDKHSIPMNAYYCICGYWHIGKRKRWRGPAPQRRQMEEHGNDYNGTEAV